MCVYRDAKQAIARIMSVETIDGTAKAGWQMAYQSGWPELRGSGCGLSEEERLTQDCMTRAMLHRDLPPESWHAMVARYSINDIEVAQSVHWLVARVRCPGHHLFKVKCVTAWAIPKRLPAGFYELSSWDADGTPEGTLRRWRADGKRWLNDRLDAAFMTTEALLQLNGLLMADAA